MQANDLSESSRYIVCEGQPMCMIKVIPQFHKKQVHVQGSYYPVLQ